MTEPLTEHPWWSLFARLFPDRLDDSAIARELPGRRWQELSGEAVADLLGQCLWDVFSHNHEVFTAEGSVVDLGSFRESAAFIADLRSQRPSRGDRVRDARSYLDFYMGTLGIDDGADLGPLYESIFRRMRRVGLDWRYVHPRLIVVDLSELPGGLGSGDPVELDPYDPSESLARELDGGQRAAELAELNTSLDRAYHQSVGRARANPPPAVVQAYRRVYGKLPEGWPPTWGPAAHDDGVPGSRRRELDA